MTNETTTAPRIAVIGGGQMARALIGGWVASGIPISHIAVSDPVAAQREWLAGAFPGLRTEASNEAAVAGADVWLLAVKPQLLAGVMQGLRPLVDAQRPLLLSIAAGIRATDISRWAGPAATVVRAMPNRPALVAKGVSALYADPALTPAARDIALRLMQAVGSALWVGQEADLDSVTAVSGSGPAYFFLLIEALEAAAVTQGLPADAARQLAIETAMGAATLAALRTDDPATLRAQVTSKGGTTAAAIAVFEAAGLRAIVAEAVDAAARRSRELADEFGNAPR